MYKSLIRPLLFQLPPEQAHEFTFYALKALLQLPGVSELVRRWAQLTGPGLSRDVFGLRFPNPVGLAAGFDKNARLVDEMAALGFGFVEIGTVTPRPQPGNPRPRLFRLPHDGALINRMGFNNEGVAAAANRLRLRKSDVIVGGNIGKNKTTPNDAAADDYRFAFQKLFDVVDYFVVNVSSPNTPNLRALQDKAPLLHLLQTLQEENRAQLQPKPVLLKIAPDLNEAQLDDIIEIVQETNLAGVVATNTTISREGLETPPSQVEQMGMGGLSGRPLRERATEVIRYLNRTSGGAFPIVGVGGIFSPDDALEKLEAGAALVQLYTGFIYEGPGLVKAICREVNRLTVTA
ncbi:dihydroorotate dehydrogenase [Catalinimonas alkaloidigena]|uniref:Dihydroorotate dehydrogenase (quinone) n=1 Tax=Catalinimonas alkaloidigena TaxID=1075417 RepID=A0A1G9DD17_9BACT|nr:quinone-dependent dihydroorotate dehydrogenase [Catalinimonas alkaloidigena]SDK61755.1 dihydroorotate dehydrogenase [Catalinimonas alkaloidigena]